MCGFAASLLHYYWQPQHDVHGRRNKKTSSRCRNLSDSSTVPQTCKCRSSERACVHGRLRPDSLALQSAVRHSLPLSACMTHVGFNTGRASRSLDSADCIQHVPDMCMHAERWPPASTGVKAIQCKRHTEVWHCACLSLWSPHGVARVACVS